MIRCFEGVTKPNEPFWRWKNQAAAAPENTLAPRDDMDEPELELYGYISEYSWWEDDITPQLFRDDLYKYGGGGPITIRMNSYGGDVIAASLIHSMIKDYPGKVTVRIDGVAASAATVVAIAGDVVRMRETAYFMIHDPSVVFFLAQLNIEELSRMADRLQAVKEGIVNAYESKTGMSRPRLAKLMTEETWMDANEAKLLGFVDEIVGKDEGGKGRANAIKSHEWDDWAEWDDVMDRAAIVNAVKHYRNVPEGLLRSLIDEPDQPGDEPGISEAAVGNLRAEMRLYK